MMGHIHDHEDEHNHHHEHNDDDHYYDDTVLQDNQVIFLNHYIEMLQICDEGIEYLSIRIKKESYLDVTIFSNCIDAFKSIQEANFLSWNIMKKIDREVHDSIRSFEDFLPIFEQVLTYQEEGNYQLLADTLKEQLFPHYLDWSKKVQEAFKPYLQH